MRDEENEDEQLRWETEVESETARLRSVIDMLSTALTVAMGGKPNCTATETQLIRSALLIARGVVKKADLHG